MSEKVLLVDDEKDFLESVAQLCACSIEKARLMESQKFKFDLLALHRTCAMWAVICITKIVGGEW